MKRSGAQTSLTLVLTAPRGHNGDAAESASVSYTGFERRAWLLSTPLPVSASSAHTVSAPPRRGSPSGEAVWEERG